MDASSRAVSDLVGKKTELDGLTPRIAGVRTQTTEARERAAQYRDKVGKSEALIGRGPEIEEGYKRLASAQDEEARLTRALVSKNRLDGLLAEQEQAIAVEAQRLAARREQLAETAAELSARSDGVPALERALADLEPERERLGSMERRIKEDGVVERSLRGRLEASEGLRRRYDQTSGAAVRGQDGDSHRARHGWSRMSGGSNGSSRSICGRRSSGWTGF